MLIFIRLEKLVANYQIRKKKFILFLFYVFLTVWSFIKKWKPSPKQSNKTNNRKLKLKAEHQNLMTREHKMLNNVLHEKLNRTWSHVGPPSTRYELNLPSRVTLLEISLATEFATVVYNSKEQLLKSEFNMWMCSMKTRYLGHSNGFDIAS